MGKSGQSLTPIHPLCARLTEIRQLYYGDRGRSSFARDLGIPVTSYVHYESGRIPPADLLVNAARVTGTSLIWLLTGAGERAAPPPGPVPSPVQRVIDELLRLLTHSPHLLKSAQEFVQLLSRIEQGGIKPAPELPPTGAGHLIPIVGSTAAGLAHFWHELEVDAGGSAADSRLEKILQLHTQKALETSGQTVVNSSNVSEPVALVQYSRPDENGFLEFLSAGELKAKYPAAVAWRIDGESMSPRFQDGDLVITSPGFPAVEMQPCVARQRGQIGVNCKLYQTIENEVLLIPIHEGSSVQRFPRSQLLWAWRVLASVRLS
ncbi:S24 family peptidase [Planctomicrobium sp. SH661]|uniref:S24 family peptidase n=1 Tax=Planctomicrobium sp. SH661 TaxID=3448124 RepID=UPI003F5C8885